MATKWSRNKVDSSTINSGNEYEKGDRVARQSLNAMVNAGLYAQDFAEALADTPDTSEAGNVGTPSVQIIDNIKDGKTYKKFKFLNLKGKTGVTPNLTITATIDNSTGTPNVTVTKSGLPEEPHISLAFTGMKGEDGGSTYANTSEGQTSGLSLNTSSTLTTLATQILAAQTKVISAPIGKNITSSTAVALRRLLGSPFNGNYERVEFKVFSQVLGAEKIIEVVGLQQSTSKPRTVRGQLVYNDAGENYEWQWTGWSSDPYPIGTYYWRADSTSPALLFGGTWTQITDVFLLAASSITAANPTYVGGNSGGEATHALTIAEMPRHNHTLSINNDTNPDLKITYYASWATGSLTGTPLAATSSGNGAFYIYANTVGDSAAHNNMPPYTVGYLWKRIA